MDIEWMSARDALARLEAAMPKSPRLAAGSLVNAAAAGIVSTLATRLIRQDAVLEDCEPPSEFWRAAARHPQEHAWEVGSFNIWFEGEKEWEAFGVRFDRAAIEEMAPITAPAELEPAPLEQLAPTPATVESKLAPDRG